MTSTSTSAAPRTSTRPTRPRTRRAAVVMVYQPDGKGRVFATGDPQRRRALLRSRRRALDRGQRARPDRLPVPPGLRQRRRCLRPGDQRLRRQPPARRARQADAGSRPRLALLQPRPRRRPRARRRQPSTTPNLPFDADAQENPGGTVLDCAKLAPLERGLPAHSAPLGFHFLEGSSLPAPWTDGAVVVLHGSWDRTPPRPPAVLWLPWEAAAKTLGSPVDARRAASRLATEPAWDVPSTPSQARTGLSTSPTTPPGPSTASPRPPPGTDPRESRGARPRHATALTAGRGNADGYSR